MKLRHKVSKTWYSLLILPMVAIATFVCLSLINPTTNALPVVGFEAGRIIDDNVFTNANIMNKDQIQAFLNSKVPVCDTNGTQPSEYGGGTRAQWGQAHYGQSTFPCLKDYIDGGKSSAQIIYDAAQEFQINPQVLIVLLQKEQGLVTDTWPLNIQYRSATGYGCPDTAACDSQYYGLTNQIRWSARMFRAIMNNSPTWYTPYVLGVNYIRWNPASSCGGSNVDIQNRSTQALYNYTPYQPNQSALNAGYGTGDSCGAYGNRNFYLYFTDWFGPTKSGKAASPLFKSNSSPIIYAIANSTKYPIASPDIIVAYGWWDSTVTIVSDAALNGYSTGPTISTPYAKKMNDDSGTIYLFDDGKRFPITMSACRYNPDSSPVVNTTWSIDCFNTNVVFSLPNTFIDRFSTQDINIPTVISYDNYAWKIENGTKRRIMDNVFVEILGGKNNVRYMKAINASQPEGKMLIPAGSIVKLTSGAQLYLKTDSSLLPISNVEDFKSWKLEGLPTYVINGAFNTSDPLPVGTPLSHIAKDISNNYYFITADGKRIALAPSQTDWVTTGATTDIDSYLPKLSPITSTGFYRSASSGAIFVIENGKRRPVPTPGDFAGINPTSLPVVNVTSAAENALTYDGLKLAKFRVFKITGGDGKILYVETDTNSLHVTSTSAHPNLPYGNLINVDAITGGKYPVTGTY